ncbi:sialic acid-binding Ig-like lectin 12 [Garra rufa]|uniref:sialic acid-binding Ig-like lectin 12 n=1 Tax=Garra rufa TaxID=137080 RepID=UPI003CCED900
MAFPLQRAGPNTITSGFCHLYNFKTAVKTETEEIEWLEPDLTKNNCSIIIEEIKEDDKKYAFKIVGENSNNSKVKIIIQDEPAMKVPLLSEGQEANLTCSAPFPCPETPPKITWWIKTRGENKIDLTEYNITLTTTNSFHLSTLILTPTIDLHNATVGCDVSYGRKNISTNMTLKVMYVKPLLILGNGKVTEGDNLSLNCTVESHPPSSVPVWSFNGNTDRFMNQTSAEYLTITNVTKEHAGVYGCTSTYKNKTLNAFITINVTNKQTHRIKTSDSSYPRFCRIA